MGRDAELLFGLLAVQQGFVSGDRLLECAQAGSIPENLRAAGMPEDQVLALNLLVAAHLRIYGGDESAALGMADVDARLKGLLRE